MSVILEDFLGTFVTSTHSVDPDMFIRKLDATFPNSGYLSIRTAFPQGDSLTRE